MVDTNIVNSEEFRDRIYEKLNPSGWNAVLKTYIKSQEFVNLLNTLQEDVKYGKRFTPRFTHVFNAFLKCKYDNVKVVLLATEPYVEINTADGMAFSCSIKDKTENGLKHFYTGTKTPVRNDLSYLAEQGVLLLNTSLTVQLDKPGSHIDYWKPFMSHLLDQLSTEKPDLVYLLLGEHAEFWEDLIDDYDKIVKAPMPSMVYEKEYTWDCNDCFNKVNDILVSQELPEIKW